MTPEQAVELKDKMIKEDPETSVMFQMIHNFMNNADQSKEDEKFNLMVSYPRSGSTFVRYIIEHFTGRPTIGPGPSKVDFPVIPDWSSLFISAFKNHGQDTHHQTIIDLILSKNIPLILLIRNPIEVFPRHTSIKESEYIFKYDSINKIPESISYFFKSLQTYDNYSGKKKIFYYEDLVTKPQDFIKELCLFLGVDKDGTMLEDFMETYEKHSSDSRRFYNRHQSEKFKFLIQWKLEGDSSRLSTPISVSEMIEAFKEELGDFTGADFDIEKIKIRDTIIWAGPNPDEMGDDALDPTTSAATLETLTGREIPWNFAEHHSSGPAGTKKQIYIIAKHGPGLIGRSLFIQTPTDYDLSGTRSDGKTTSKYRNNYDKDQIQTYWKNFKTLCNGDSWKICERYMK